MRKILALAVLLSSVQLLNIAHADTKLPDWFNKLDPQQGIAFNLVDNKLNSYTSVKLAEWKMVSLRGGAIGDADSLGWGFGGSVGVKLLELKNYVDLPILDKVIFEPGIYFGVGKLDGNGLFEDSETSWGITASLVSFQW